MSAEATGWVFKSSPYSGALFTLHLAIADIVNDTHRNELWASVRLLGEKARISERSVRSGLARMVQDGLLELVAAHEGQVRRYRFLMPDPCNGCTPATAAPLQPDAQTPANERATPANERETPAVVAPYPKRTQENSSSTATQTLAADIEASHHQADPFDAFWSVYPLRKAKGAARKAWKSALSRATTKEIIAGARSYAEDPARETRYTKHPATWLNADCWLDDNTPNRVKAKGVTAAERALHRYAQPLQEARDAIEVGI